MWGFLVIGLVLSIIISRILFLDFEEGVYTWVVTTLICFIIGFVINTVVEPPYDFVLVETVTPISIEQNEDGTDKYIYEFEDSYEYVIEEEYGYVKESLSKDYTYIKPANEYKIEVYECQIKGKLWDFFFCAPYTTRYTIYCPEAVATETFETLNSY